MNATELIFAQGTSEPMKQLAQQIPPYDLLKAYRDATIAFASRDVVLVVASGTTEEQGFVAMPRSAYIEKAFARWNNKQRSIHPLAKESAHKKMKMPAESPAFWLVIEDHDNGAMSCCAIGAFLHEAEVTGLH